MTLDNLGWQQYKQKLNTELAVSMEHVGRVIAEHKTNVTLATTGGEKTGVLRGKAHQHLDEYTKPKVGDWVVCANCDEGEVVAIESILPRFSTLRRNASGVGKGPQVLVTNIDYVFVIQGLDHNFNLNRLERYLVMVENSEATPIIILNKVDLVEDTDRYRSQVEQVAPHVPVILLSSLSSKGVQNIKPHLKQGTTSVFVGSSGVGKSTMLNRLMDDEVQPTQGLRDDDQGRHTTTRRELFMLSNGALVIDTPGMRELSVKGLATITETFGDLDDLACQCKFRDCDHERSKGCALQNAVVVGYLDTKRVANYLKLQKELAYTESQANEKSKQERREQVKKLHKGYRQMSRAMYKERGYK